jgi:cytochrome P450
MVELDTSSGSQCPRRLATKQFMHDPYPMLASIRDTGPAVVVENRGFRMWVITRYEDGRRILADSTFCKDIVLHRKKVVAQNLERATGSVHLPHASRRSVLDRDGADHRRLRSLLSGTFTASRLAEYRPHVERLAHELLDRLAPGSHVDVIAEFARPLSATFIADLVGLPEDERNGFPIWENAMLTGSSNEEVTDGGQQLYELALRMIELKRREPEDDLYTQLLRAHDEDGLLDDDELASMYIVLLVGGSEPTSAIGNGLLLLLSHPDALARIREDPCLIPGCVEEILRYESPFRLLPPRFSDHPLELDGITVPAGELILISPAAANRDPLRFPDPDCFDLERNPKGHLGFGHGAHYCLGAELGRLETTIALRAFTARFPNSRLDIQPEQADWRPGTFMRRLDTLPVTLG